MERGRQPAARRGGGRSPEQVAEDRRDESPFLDISPQGPEALFPRARVEQMVQVLDEIRRRAAG